MEPTESPSPDRPLLKRKTPAWSATALGLALSLIPLKWFLGDGTALAAGGLSTGFAAYVAFWCHVHPKIYLGKGMALAALLVSGAVTYTAFGQLAYGLMWRQTFQISGGLAKFEDRAGGWSVEYPEQWSHEEQRASGTVNHVFKPSKVAPAMFFSVAHRSNVGTTDIDLVVQSFFMNLPREAEAQILEREAVTLPSGRKGYRIVYNELSRRIPLKNEILFVLDGPRLFCLTVGAAPRWFDRHRDTLEKLLFTLQIPSQPPPP